MGIVLLDTNIVSFQFRNDTRLQQYTNSIRDEIEAISFVTLAELYKWPLERNFSSAREAALQKLMAGYVVLPFDDSLARIWASVSVTMKRAGHGISDSDSWIAATALRHDLPLVTHNGRHFERVPDLSLITYSI